MQDLYSTEASSALPSLTASLLPLLVLMHAAARFKGEVALSFMHGNSSGSTTSIRGKLPMFFAA
jgi:hypothetical protein